MTQSGQGEEPSARPAREGIVLPSDGGEPLLPGMTQVPPQPSRPGRSRPAEERPAPQPYDETPYGQDQYGQGQYGSQYGQDPYGGDQYGQPHQQGQHSQQGQPQQQGQYGQDPYRQDAYGTQQPSIGEAWSAQAPPQAQAQPQGPGPGPLPPEGAPAPSYGGPQQPAYGGQGLPGAGPLPPVDEGATQFIPPVTAGPPIPADEGATQFLPPVPAAPDEGATQFLPPVAPGALPPENPAESTHYLGQAPRQAAGPYPGAGDHPDAQTTQYIPPVPGGQGPPSYGGGGAGAGGERQPPAEFDNLFRTGPGGDSPAAATQHLPRVTDTDPPHPGGGPRGPRGPRDEGRGSRSGGGGTGRSGRGGSKVPLIVAVGVALAVIGVGAGALMAGGGGGEADDSRTVAASQSATDDSGSGSGSDSADAAKEQAEALDKLLADSGSSRASVIAAVADVKRCGNLAQAATDLRDAGRQRTGLVTKLEGLSVDKLPQHAALTAALTKAWQASASADDHYAAWADQVAAQRGKLCRKGQARSTGDTQQGNRASGTATAQKAKAAQLWNTIARTYGLTERQPTQL
ncbi:hypothetical protein ACIQPQ_13330 [Streptomyces sp. NPDC091281]|uniref:hypothetical protein n=1 Tax=Streptomyces sp. NPDC091281 TaxID=3365985 RepID=UPI0037F7CC1B